MAIRNYSILMTEEQARGARLMLGLEEIDMPEVVELAASGPDGAPTSYLLLAEDIEEVYEGEFRHHCAAVNRLREDGKMLRPWNEMDPRSMWVFANSAVRFEPHTDDRETLSLREEASEFVRHDPDFRVFFKNTA